MKREEETPEDLSPEREGMPQVIDGPPERGPKESSDEGMSLPGEYPNASRDRVTAREQREGQTLDERLDEEAEPQPNMVPRQGGRLVGPGDELEELDKTHEEVADEADESRGGFTAEEAAVRVERDR